VATVILLRHGRSRANGSGILAGRSPRVDLDETGRCQAAALDGRLADVPLTELLSSPLLRCKQTLAPLGKARGLRSRSESRFTEVDYGEWTGQQLQELAEEPLWRVVQEHPSAAVFPGGEGLAAVQARAVRAVREHDARITETHGESAVWLLCTHGDVIKAIVADAMGLHLDLFQRIAVDPASLSVVRYTETRPFVLRTNDHSDDLKGIVPSEPEHSERKSAAHADVGGSTG